MRSFGALASSQGARAVGIALRTGHIAAMSVLVGGIWFDLPKAQFQLALALTVATGVALTASEMSHSRHWIHQWRGLFVLVHLGLAALAVHLPAAGGRQLGAAAAVIVGSIGSHLPRAIRKWSILLGRVVE